jgi:hypothetical protein
MFFYVACLQAVGLVSHIESESIPRREERMVRKKYANLIKDVPAELRKPAPAKQTHYGDRITDMPVMAENPGALPMVRAAMGKNHAVNVGWFLVPVIKPVLMVDEPHLHDFDQFICFLGSNPHNIGYLGAEIELYLGKEHEKHIITSPKIVHLTPGLIHCPLFYKKVTQPVFHLDIYLAEEYIRKPVG